MELETLNRLFLELSQVTTAQTAKEQELRFALLQANELCRSMHAIVERQGAETNWAAFGPILSAALIEQHRLLHPTSPTTD